MHARPTGWTWLRCDERGAAWSMCSSDPCFPSGRATWAQPGVFKRGGKERVCEGGGGINPQPRWTSPVPTQWGSSPLPLSPRQQHKEGETDEVARLGARDGTKQGVAVNVAHTNTGFLRQPAPPTHTHCLGRRTASAPPGGHHARVRLLPSHTPSHAPWPHTHTHTHPSYPFASRHPTPYLLAASLDTRRRSSSWLAALRTQGRQQAWAVRRRCVAVRGRGLHPSPVAPRPGSSPAAGPLFSGRATLPPSSRLFTFSRGVVVTAPDSLLPTPPMAAAQGP